MISRFISGVADTLGIMKSSPNQPHPRINTYIPVKSENSPREEKPPADKLALIKIKAEEKARLASNRSSSGLLALKNDKSPHRSSSTQKKRPSLIKLV